jgi:N-acetylglucosaminyl-diphospho-decaprenol L-rhamnosyltransferase
VTAPEAGRPDLSVVVVTFNRTDMAMRTISSARSSVGGITAEWHVVDSGSTEPVADTIERAWPDIQVLRGPNAGFAAANNLALPHARGRYVLLLNPDVEIEAGTFEALVSALDSRPEVGMASVIQQAADGSLQYSIRRDPSPLRMFGEALAPGKLSKILRCGEVEARSSSYSQESTADWLCGAFLIARAEVIEQIGGLDDEFFLYSEETDWCYRCRQAGWAVRHLPVMTVTHDSQRGYSSDQMAQLTYSRILFSRKHMTHRQRAALRFALALNHALRVSAATVAARFRESYRSRAAAEGHGLSVALGRSGSPFSKAN